MQILGKTESGLIRVIFDGQEGVSFVPDTEHDRERTGITAWEAEGNTIPPYAPPAIDLNAYTATKRWEREVGGIVVGGLDVATDDRSKIMISGARMKADKDTTFTAQWKCPDGSFITLDAATIIHASDAVLDHVNDCFSIEADVLAAIGDGSISTTADVDAAFAAQLSPESFQTRG